MGKRLTFIIGRMRRVADMREGKDSPERRQATAPVETSREDTRARSGYCVDGAPIVLKRVIPAGRLSDEEMPGRIIEAVA